MRWFKHISTSQNDEKMSELMDKFGAEGYGVWWLILERIAEQMDETSRTFVRLSVKVWAKSCRISAKNFQNIVKFLESSGIFLLKFENEYLTINCPNLSKYRDEWSKKKIKNSVKTPESLRSHSGATPEQDTDTDTDTEKDIYDLAKAKSLSGKPDAAPLSQKNSEIKKQAIEVLEFLNEKTGKSFRPVDTNLKFIIARLKSGAHVEDCRAVIAKKYREWRGDQKMIDYVRPATLFNATKFEQYFGELNHEEGK